MEQLTAGSLRNRAQNLFKLILDSDIAEKLEKKLFKQSQKISSKDPEKEYIFIVYQIYGLLLNNSIEKVAEILKAKRYGWNSEIYDEFKKKQEEYDTFLEVPFEVSEGVLECGNCGGKKILSFQKQLRGGDESMTTISKCLACKNEWTYSG